MCGRGGQVSQGYNIGGKIAAQRVKKQRAEEKRAARKRLQEAIELTYVDPVSGCVVTVLHRGYAYGAEPAKGISQRDFDKRRFG
jgi:hypothetical protein